MSFVQSLVILVTLLLSKTSSTEEKIQCLNRTDLEDEERTVLVDTELEVVYAKQYHRKGKSPSSCNEDNGTCPLWFTYDNSSNSCQCGDDLHGVIHCNQTRMKVYLKPCNCMSSLDHDSKQIAVVGTCFYTCNFTLDSDLLSYIKLPDNISDLEEKLCYPTNRQGLLCGQCREGFYPPLYSYEYKCVNCTNTNVYYNLAKYFLIAIVPVTVFLIAVICFRISATSPQLNAFIFTSQELSALPSIVAILPYLESMNNGAAMISFKTGFFFHGIWNLDHFRGLFSPICLDVTTRQALAMDYIVAFYPILLLAAAYIFIQLHARNCRVIVWLWRPFHRCFARFRREWDIRTSVIDAFATFLLLAYTKLNMLIVSGVLVLPVKLYTVSGNGVGGLHSYYDGSVDVVDGIQILFSLLIIILFLFFNVFPAFLLLLYPFSWFQHCLDRCCLHRHALQAFADAFEGYYKDGTNGDPDRRWFAAVYIIARIALFITFAVTVGAYSIPAVIAVLMILVVMVVTLQPYKQKYAVYNKIDVVLIIVLSLWYVSMQFLVTASTIQFQFLHFSLIIFIMLLFCPLVYITAVLLYWFFCRARFPQRLLSRCQLWRRVTARRRRESGADLLPDRIINPGNYGAVLQHAAGADDGNDMLPSGYIDTY